MPKDIVKQFLDLYNQLPNSKQNISSIARIIKTLSKRNKINLSKPILLKKYRQYCIKNNCKEDKKLLYLLRKKPTRSNSGVAVITIFTKPYDCPGKCIFCPTEDDVPKSYLSPEPACARAIQNNFDPYWQVIGRLQVIRTGGHNTNKAEIIVDGGTFLYYPKRYTTQFMTKVFAALNSFPIVEPTKDHYDLIYEQKINETVQTRCVGLSIESRPDYINHDNLLYLRKLGVTKVQLGVQSMNDDILHANKRGHSVRDSINAANLLRLYGFKIHAHIMPNLYKSNPQNDIDDMKKLFNSSVCPDELKIYPTVLLRNTALYILYKQGKYKPYTTEELIRLVAQLKLLVPRYCRITRVFRDIPSDLIVAGNKKTNLRQMVHQYMQEKLKKQCVCIRCREVKDASVEVRNIKFSTYEYLTEVSKEIFIEATANNLLLGFLRLSIPSKNFQTYVHIKALHNSAMIRELHVYGPTTQFGKEGITQHTGIGSKLLSYAYALIKKYNFPKISVISAVGTRKYYEKHDFKLIDYGYMQRSVI